MGREEKQRVNEILKTGYNNPKKIAKNGSKSPPRQNSPRTKLCEQKVGNYGK